MFLNTSSLPEAYDFDTILRELSWLKATKPIWQSTEFVDQSLDKLCSSDITQAARDLERTWSWHGVPRRLGRRFEALITAYFEHATDIQILGHSITVYRNKTSIGEIDFILKFKEEVIHLEVALKFYAGVQIDTRINWVGPSCRDHFTQKKMHLLNHQLPVINSLECLDRLDKLKIDRPNRSIGLIFGYLMQPWDRQISLDCDMTDNSRSYWCTHQSFHSAARRLTRPFGTAYGWRYVPRAQWTAPHVTSASLPLLTQPVAPEHADCYVLAPKYSYDIEKLRLFVLPDNFLEKAALTFDKD